MSTTKSNPNKVKFLIGYDSINSSQDLASAPSTPNGLSTNSYANGLVVQEESSTDGSNTKSSLNGSPELSSSDITPKLNTSEDFQRKMSGLSLAKNGYANGNNQSSKKLLRKLSEQYEEVKVMKSVDEFVQKLCGNRVIKTVLIANNGIAAVKCMRSIRRWCYEVFRNERAIKFAVMYTPEDLKANAEYIRMADHCVPVPGGSNNNNYANCELILDIAKRIPVQAVWAGWGHASENPKLPELLNRHAITFIGPPEQAMWALGDKIASSIVAETAGVPTLPWSGSGLKVAWSDADRLSGRICSVDMGTYGKACVNTVDEGLERAKFIGYPLMIKASEGGGGKGIRKVCGEEEFATALRQVQAEVPGSPVFIMKYAPRARHIEVQIIADNYGNAIALFGRDCSIQRRHQKIIEEAPAIITDPDVFINMERDAVKLAKMVGYVSTGTVEYLYNPEDSTYCFLELNPRLQVEHPCTEMITGLNLPACQIQIAMGISLHRIK